MVIVQLLGGLGNQMFQYALGRQLATLLDTKLKLDISMFQNYKLRKYELGCFNCIENFATEDDLKEIYLYGWRKRIWQIKKYINNTRYNFKKYTVVQEKQNFVFDPDIFNMTGNLFFKGYWQNEKYFSSIADSIRSEFTLRVALSSTSQSILNQIQTGESVAVHIRRGDYITNPTTNLVHGVLPLEYYHLAINTINAKYNQIKYFFFSDDSDWVVEYFGKIDNAIIVANDSIDKDYEDMYLMSQCKHNIIANSSFSWWAAWLNQSSDKIVIAPKQWIRCDYNTKDLIPAEWVRL